MSHKPKTKGPIRKSRIIKPPGVQQPEVEMHVMPLAVAQYQRDLLFRMAKLLGFREIEETESALATMEELNEHLDKLEAGDNGDPKASDQEREGS
jgi:hypothetical protein